MNPNEAKATIAIVGRPNVGKSTLFNRLIGKKIAITAKEAGTTRDRVQQTFNINGYTIELIDTGGLQTGKKESLEIDTEKQAKIGIEKADLILFVIDTIEPLTSDDFLVANILRKSNKPIILIANKCDHQKIEENIYNIYELGFGEPIKVSSIHKLGVDELEESIILNLKKLKIKKSTKKEKDEEIINISIIGRPNVGKSSLVNSLLGEERMIVSEIPGTTRDSADILIEYQGKKINLIDTAGLRKRGRIDRGIEKFSMLRAKESVKRSDIAIVVIDATEPATSQDLHVIEIALKEKKGVILAVNKSDIADGRIALNKISHRCDFLPWAPVVFISAKNKKNINKLLDIAIEIKEVRKTKIQTSKLNNFLQKAVLKNFPKSTTIQRTKFFYGTQTDTNPPRFTFFFRNAKSLHFSYKRYLENELRKEFGFTGTPVIITLLETPSK
jgi:GTP-binding protein